MRPLWKARWVRQDRRVIPYPDTFVPYPNTFVLSLTGSFQIFPSRLYPIYALSTANKLEWKTCGSAARKCVIRQTAGWLENLTSIADAVHRLENRWTRRRWLGWILNRPALDPLVGANIPFRNGGYKPVKATKFPEIDAYPYANFQNLQWWIEGFVWSRNKHPKTERMELRIERYKLRPIATVGQRRRSRIKRMQSIFGKCRVLENNLFADSVFHINQIEAAGYFDILVIENTPIFNCKFGCE